MHANLTHLFVCFLYVCVSACQIFVSAFLQKASLTLLGHFFRESSEHLSETKDAEPFLLRLIWLSSLLEPSHLLLSPSNLHNQITHLLLSSVAFDVTLSPQCFVWLLEINFLDTSLICKDSCTTFTSRPSILLLEIFFFASLLRKYLFLSMYFDFYQLNRIAKLKSFTHQHQVAWLKNKKELNDYFLLFLLGRSTWKVLWKWNPKTSIRAFPIPCQTR